MQKGDFIFVYGTLRKGERADLSKSASSFSVKDFGMDTINGKLYHLGAFPGVKLLQSPSFDDSLPKVIGRVFFVLDPSIGAILDAYEGYRVDSPKSGLYDRELVETFHGRLAWVYTYNGMVSEDQLIETGDWKNPRITVTRQIPKVR